MSCKFPECLAWRRRERERERERETERHDDLLSLFPENTTAVPPSSSFLVMNNPAVVTIAITYIFTCN